ncbi:hypothetical protein PV11_09786 [Exophiala sideris]|uniref:TIGR00267 family protein n=1 Tax=Exophiala sideris TaxID=1016849 RepID=A0A0D1YB79_9EURO|nr:hypothetical protein PV11_09786 [Exophiala sideris]
MLTSDSRSVWKRIDSRMISDATIGLADGLTVPFALTAGLSTLGKTDVVVYGGLAELIAGAISMGFGGYLAGRGEADAHAATQSNTSTIVRSDPDRADSLIQEAFDAYDLPAELADSLSSHVRSLPKHVQTEFLMRFCTATASPEAEGSRAITSGITIATGYFLGGLIPLLPYALVGGSVGSIETAFFWSVAVMIVALLSFGAGKTWLLLRDSQDLANSTAELDEMSGAWEKQGTSSGSKNLALKCMRGSVEMLVLGSLAAGAAMGIIKVLT